MTRLNFDINEEELLRAYKISSLKPTKWEEVDHDLEYTIGTPFSESSGLFEREREMDPLGLPQSVDVKEMNPEARAAILITSKTFDSAAYLSAVHPNATYHDLATGIGYLQNAIDARAEAIRILVEDHFDKFTSVKATIEDLREDMKSGILGNDFDYGSKPLRDHLKLGGQKANQIFLPVLETASKARKLRTTLAIFERSKFFFNLPSFIIESIDAGRYDLAIRDYKKGKYILENRPGQLLSIVQSKDEAAALSEQQRQKRILNKVWTISEKAMAEMRGNLVCQLEDPNRTVEENERTLETLMDFHSNDEPLWTYFEWQHKYIINRMTSEHENGVKKIEASLCDIKASNTLILDELRIAISQLQTNRQYGVPSSNSVTDSGWRAVLDLIKIMSDSITPLHKFWTISRNLINGKFKKFQNTSGTQRSPSQCRTMALSIVKHYISLISQIFLLSDVVIMASLTSDAPRPALLPQSSHSLSTANHQQRILAELEDCVNDIKALDISADVNQGLKSLFESVQWRFLDILGRDWLKDAKLFRHLESWTIDPQNVAGTSFPSQFELFQKHLAIASHKIIVTSQPGHISAPFASTGSRNTPISRAKSKAMPLLVTKFTKTFMDALYSLLDGLTLLVVEDLTMKEPGIFEFDQGTTHEIKYYENFDVNDPIVRTLLVLSNIKHFDTVFFNMISQLESSFSVKLTDDRKMLKSVIEKLDEKLFNEFVQPKCSVFVQKVRDGILLNDFDWYDAPQPTCIRPYVYDIMNGLVELHAQVYTVSEGLLERTMNAVLDQLVNQAVECFNQVEQFGTGGLLTAVIELSFIHRSLGYYGRETAAGKRLEDLYTQQITNTYSPSAMDTDFNTSFQTMQKTLSDARRASAVQFLCFRQTNLKLQENMKGGDRQSG